MNWRSLALGAAGRRERLIMLGCYAVLLVARMPHVLFGGRFWAEEGVVYFANALHLPWYRALVAPHSGYMNLTASAATLLAAFDVAHAPWISTTIALLVQLCPAILLLRCSVPWLQGRLVLVLALLAMALPVNGAEIWLNSITSQFHLALCVALILALPLERRVAARVFPGFLLVLAPLSGPIAGCLAPLFLLRAALERSRARLVQAVLLGGATLVQMAIMAAHAEPDRVIGIGPHMLLLIAYIKHIVIPLDGLVEAHDIATRLTQVGQLGHPVVTAAGVTIIVALGMALAIRGSRIPEASWLFAGGLLVMALSYVGALGAHSDLLQVTFGMRYAYVPNALFSLTLLALATRPGFVQGAAALLLVWVLAVGGRAYFNTDQFFASGPGWRSVLAAWRADPEHRMQAWPPSSDWLVRLGPPPG